MAANRHDVRPQGILDPKRRRNKPQGPQETFN
jgi:hypothetical protein